MGCYVQILSVIDYALVGKGVTSFGGTREVCQEKMVARQSRVRVLKSSHSNTGCRVNNDVVSKILTTSLTSTVLYDAPVRECVRCFGDSPAEHCA